MNTRIIVKFSLICTLCLIVCGCGVAAKNVIGQSQYEQLKTGMTYDEAVKVIGAPGSKNPTNTKTDNYVWLNPDNSWASASFKNGKLEEKSQKDLK